MAEDQYIGVVVSNDSVVADGEYHQLIQSLEEEDDNNNNFTSSEVPSVIGSTGTGSDVVKARINDDTLVWYGHPLSVLEAQEQMSNHRNSSITGTHHVDTGGLLWQISIIPNEMMNNVTTSTTNRSASSTAISMKRSQGWNHRDFFLSQSSVSSNHPTTLGQEQAERLSTAAGTTTTTTTIQIKPRRPSLPVAVNDFVSSLTKLEYHNTDRTNNNNNTMDTTLQSQPRYIFHGVLNGWPGLRTLELVSLEYRRNSSNNTFSIPSPRELLSGQLLWVKAWSINDTNNNITNINVNAKIDDAYTKSSLDTTTAATTSMTPILLQSNRIYRATVRGASWTTIGWSPDSPGFCFWNETQRPSPLVSSKVTYGTRMIHELSHRDNICTYIHMISHRYAVNRVETPRDRLTYHSICLLEWDHGLYCTLVETAYLNGMGGYKCRSNWYADKDVEPMNQLYRDFPDEMICPWRMTQSEIRCYDVPAKNLNEFRTYMSQYNESAVPPTVRRFIDVRCTFSHPARLTFRSKVHIAQYLLNYILRDSSYGDLNRNCQTFAADFCSFIAGKKGIAPFHPVNRIEYQNRTHMFLYDSHLYDKKRGNKK